MYRIFLCSTQSDTHSQFFQFSFLSPFPFLPLECFSHTYIYTSTYISPKCPVLMLGVYIWFVWFYSSRLAALCLDCRASVFNKWIREIEIRNNLTMYWIIKWFHYILIILLNNLNVKNKTIGMVLLYTPWFGLLGFE